jgi:hypothetical protein
MVREDCWREVHRLFHGERRSNAAIARQLALDRKTVRTILRAAAWHPYRRSERPRAAVGAGGPDPAPSRDHTRPTRPDLMTSTRMFHSAFLRTTTLVLADADGLALHDDLWAGHTGGTERDFLHGVSPPSPSMC